MTVTVKRYNLAPLVYSTKIYTQLREFEENIYVMNHNKSMAYPIRNFSDRGYGIHSTMRKQLLSQIDLSKSHSAICESINRINDVTWLLNPNENKPLLVKDLAIKNLKLIAEESNRQPEEPEEATEPSLPTEPTEPSEPEEPSLPEEPEEPEEPSILPELIDIEAQNLLNEQNSINEQKLVEFIQMAKLNLYYKVCEFEHEVDPEGEAIARAERDTRSEASSSTSYQTCSNYLRPVAKSIPLTYFFKGHDIRFLYHKWYLHHMLFFKNKANVARDLFFENPNERNYEKLRRLHDNGVEYLQDYLDTCLQDKLIELDRKGKRVSDPTAYWKRIQTKTTMIFHKTSAGDYFMIYGNILGLVTLAGASASAPPSLISATLFDSGLFHDELVHDLVYNVFVESEPFQTKIPSNYYYYDYFPDLFNSFSKYLESVKNALPWHTEQPPCYYEEVAYPVMDAIENHPFDPNNANSHIPPEMNAHHPNLDPGIQWGKVVLGLGMIAAGIFCVASGNIPDLSTIFRGGEGI